MVSIRSWPATIKKKINAFMIFSLTYYSITVLGMFWKEFTEEQIFPWLNAVNEYQPIYIVAVIAIGISLYKNSRLEYKISDMFWRSGIELQIMLWGTLASLMFNLGMLFSNSIEVHILVSLLAGTMMMLNWERDKIVNWTHQKLLNSRKK